VDELSACIGLARALLHKPSAPAGAARLDASLGRIQLELCGLCADLAATRGDKQHIAARQVTALERNIDAWALGLPVLRVFILPGGGAAAACLHLARTICRRAEREVVRLDAQ
jgi:cob(I)alamin adenosyltransferase